MGTMLQPLEEITNAESLRRKHKVAQDSFGQAADIFQKHRLSLAIGTDHKVMK